MYSVVFMMALSGGAEATEFGRHNCGGGGSCQGAYANGCRGGGLFQRGGCQGGGSCYGSGTVIVNGGCVGSCTGYYGNGSGCRGGGFLGHRRNGGGCWGGSGAGCWGGSGVGCWGGTGAGCVGGVVVPPDGKKKDETKKPMVSGSVTPVNAPATIVVTLPGDSKLTVDGYLTKSTGERRTLVTPAIQVGSDFVYTLQAEVVRDGRPVVQSQVITVRGGETTTAPFTFTGTSVASNN